MTTTKIAIYAAIAFVAYRAIKPRNSPFSSTQAYPYEASLKSFSLPPDMR